MKFREKLLILFVAFVLSLLGFNLIASSSVFLLKVAKEAGYGTIESYLSKCDADAYRTQHSSHRISQLALLDPEFAIPNNAIKI
ncbi:MAG: hypothetical protein GTO17_04600 [Candidatus Aminicenantes bacterium]|nr:hypothetical protein [Candidatus Aminicenantes bacterium]